MVGAIFAKCDDRPTVAIEHHPWGKMAKVIFSDFDGGRVPSDDRCLGMEGVHTDENHGENQKLLHGQNVRHLFGPVPNTAFAGWQMGGCPATFA